MSFLDYNDSALSILIFGPLLAAVIAGLIKNESLLRWWTLTFTTLAAAFSLPLYFRSDSFILPKWLSGVRPTGNQYPSTLWITDWTTAQP